MSNPLNERVANLLIEIPKLEEERHTRELFLQNFRQIEGQQPDILENVRTNQEAVARLTRTIDNKRQELISLELLMLDNSIKDLRATTGQVDGSVKSLQATTHQVNDSIKSLQETTRQLLKSSKRLERMTNILIYATVILGIIAYYQVTVDLGRSNFLVELAGIIGTPVLIAFLLLQIRRRWTELVAH